MGKARLAIILPSVFLCKTAESIPKTVVGVGRTDTDIRDAKDSIQRVLGVLKIPYSNFYLDLPYSPFQAGRPRLRRKDSLRANRLTVSTSINSVSFGHIQNAQDSHTNQSYYLFTKNLFVTLRRNLWKLSYLQLYVHSLT